jgi:hypothetical protein
MKNLNKIALIIGMVLITAFVLMMIGDKIKANVIKQNDEMQAYETWMAQNCNCLKRDISICPIGFTMINQTCMGEFQKGYTNNLLVCSQYNCSGEIKSWNNETNKWEDK